MQFINDTEYAGCTARAILHYKDLMMQMVLLKCTFLADGSGALRPAPEQDLVIDKDVQSDFGFIESEMVPVKKGCDVAVFGQAHAPGGRPTESMEVSLKIGSDLQRRLVVTGDRAWSKAGRDFRATAPQPFVTMPLTYDRAYGGAALVQDSLVGPYPDNPEGRGFVALPEHVEGILLPNVEEADQLVKDWKQQPMPGGFAPLSRAMASRNQRGMHVDLEKRTSKMSAEAFSGGHPRMSMAKYPAGSTVELMGMTPDGRWTFTLPRLEFAVQVTLGERHYSLPMTPDTLYLFPEQRKLTVIARRTLIYHLVKERKRTTRVMAGSAAAADQPTTITALREKPRAECPIECAESEAEMGISLDWLRAIHPLTEIIEQLPVCVSS
jgi:hypothetical protein